MMRENVPLSALTTLRIGGSARFLHTADSVEAIQAAVAHARSCGLPLYPIGQGSNVLAGDAPIDAVLLKMEGETCTFAPNGAQVEVIAEAALSWDMLVRAAAGEGLWGIENLAGIPGTAGAAPVQNIGADGADLAATLSWVECYDTNMNEVIRLEAKECRFAYRESRFKHEPNLIIMRIALLLSRDGAPKTAYADLQRLIDAGETLATPQAIGEAVRRVRAVKFPDLAHFGTAGSFFKNPTISADAYSALQQRYPELPGYSTPEGVKIPLAWILDRVLSLRGFSMDHVRLFDNQPLVLVTEEGATEKEVSALADAVAEKVFNATGIKIEREVRSLA
jgi:UDP-N-acetylmuramate dehydrogenase